MNEWSLDALYKGFDDEAFVNDFKKLDEVIADANAFAVHLDDKDPKKTLVNILEKLETFQTLTMRLGEYINLRQSTNTTDAKTVSLMNQLHQKCSNISKASAKFNRYFANVEDLDAYIDTFPKGVSLSVKDNTKRCEVSVKR